MVLWSKNRVTPTVTASGNISSSLTDEAAQHVVATKPTPLSDHAAPSTTASQGAERAAGGQSLTGNFDDLKIVVIQLKVEPKCPKHG